MKKGIVAIFFTAFLLANIFFGYAEAASFFMLPKSSSLNIGEELVVDLKINASDEFFNAAQATVSFPNNILELISVDKAGSSFNFWVEDPIVSNDSGTMSFIAGTARGISGGSLQIIKMKFKTKGAGNGTLSISDAAITASDGKGSNILGTVESSSVSVGTKVISPEIPVQSTIQEILPQVLTRQAVAGTKVPGAPVVTVPLYPDNSSWYNTQGEVVALWEVTEDVTAVAVALDNNPGTEPSKSEKELTTGKKFGVLPEGTWYVHVQFKNNKGWGKIAHYRINIDTTAPLSFDAYIDSEVSDNPIPTVTFNTADSLSGIGLYKIFVDGEKVAETDKNSLVLSPLSPGKHNLRVQASDKAGNSTENILPFEILPLEKPIVNFFTQTISQSETLFASGTSLPETAIIFKIKNNQGNEVSKGVINSDKSGRWEFRTADPFGSGSYSFNVTAVDARGAKSFPTEDNKFKVRALVLFSLGSIDIGWFEVLLLVVLIVLIFGILITVRQLNKNTIRGAYSTIISRDVLKFGTMMEDDLGEIKKKISLGEVSEKNNNKSEILFHIDQMFDLIGKMKKYLSQEVGKLRK